jgi:hypothetical protein
LGSPPQLEATTTKEKISAINGLANFGSRRTRLIEGNWKAQLCLSLADPGLPEAVVIRKPLSSGKNDDFTIL